MSNLDHVEARRSAPRLNLYQSVHKGLRAFMADTLTRVGSTDTADSDECQGTLTQLRTLLDVCQAHLEHENHFIHTAMEQRQAGSAKRCKGEHVEHESHIAQLRQMSDVAESASALQRVEAWGDLYQALSGFVAENYEHMLLEERQHNQVLWKHYTDEELHEIHGALVSSIPAEEMAIHFRWMVPHLSHPERLAMLSGMKQGMPAHVFKAQMDIARSLLSEQSWSKLVGAMSYDEVSHG
ncbi:MAG TPA: hemerythrin domain-containing protein [Aquabacterium sp.]|nr:hemerythrin domain-containing protein [Aquabacterium sp.]